MFRAVSILIFMTLQILPAGIQAAEGDTIPSGYKRVWSDEFTSLSLRTGGPTYDGLETGSGTWSAPGAFYSSDPRGVAGYGFDWFVDPFYDRWPAGYPAQGQFKITHEGLRIRAERPSSAMAAILPAIAREGGGTPWISGQVTSFHAVRIKPPFYFEARAKMPVGIGRPWPAIWLLTGAHRHPGDSGKEYEIDLHEGFGDDDRLHSAIHWNPRADKPEYPSSEVANMPSGVILSGGFNTWACKVTKGLQIVFFNGKEIGRLETPNTANADQFYGMILDVSAGLPWMNGLRNDGGAPSGGPHDMIVRYVRLYAPDTNGLRLR